VEQEFQTVDHRESPQGTQAIDRAAQLLTLVLDSAEPLGVSDLAVAAELPKSTASRLVSSLERHGLVRRNGARGKVQAGPAILRYAHRGVVDRNLVDLSQAPLERLADHSGETVNLAVPGLRGVEHLAQVESRHFLGTGQWVGRRVPFHCTAVGKVFLACGTATIDDAERLAEEIERVRRDGCATAIDELEVGLSSLAAPVGDGMAALSISGPTLRLDTQLMADLRPTLIHEAQALGHDMGVHAA
jgi:IclR family transcriptional regulator, acetate operon repressor